MADAVAQAAADLYVQTVSRVEPVEYHSSLLLCALERAYADDEALLQQYLARYFPQAACAVKAVCRVGRVVGESAVGVGDDESKRRR